MGLWKDLWVRLLSLLNRDREARELAEEIRFHLEMETRKNEAEGMSPREARRGAYQAFGGVERWTEEWREARGVGPIERIARELRLALRRLVREPGLFVPALGTLALGLGSTATVFALVYSVLLRPLPYPEPDQLVAVGHATPAFGVPEAGQSAGTFTHYRAASRSFSELALFYENAVSVSVTDGDAPEHVRVAMVTPSFFRVLQVQPLRGRWFQDGEGVWEPGQPRTPVIISETLWIRRYGSDPAIVGGEIEINQSSRRVVGIMPADFAFPHPQTDVWYVTEERPDRADLRFLTSRSIGRLHEGISPQSAQSELNRLIPGLADAWSDVTPSDLSDVTATVRGLQSTMVADVRKPLLLLGLTAGLVLMVTLANVVGLFLVRTERRRREFEVSRALGARPHDFARAFLVEGLVLGGLGGLVGATVASVLVGTHFGFGPAELPRIHEVHFGLSGILFTASEAVLAGVLVAAVTLARTWSSALRIGSSPAGSRSIGGRGWGRVHQGLATVQVALSLSLLVGSVAMTRTLVSVLRVDPGFNAESVTTFQMQTPGASYPSYADAAGLYGEAFREIEALPGVTRVAAVNRVPLTPAPDFLLEHVAVEGEPVQRDAPPATLSLVTPGYFQAMEIPLIQGEGFDEIGAASGAAPLVLSESLARRLFGEGPAVGRRIAIPGFPERYGPFTVAAVVGDVPTESLLGDFEQTLYVPIALDQASVEAFGDLYPFVPGQLTVVVRTLPGVGGIIPEARAIVSGLDPKVPVSRAATMQELLGAATARLRLMTLLAVVAAASALGLGIAGVYGIVAYSVSRRTSEIGLRMALGSTPHRVERLILREVGLIAGAGVSLGIAISVLMTGALRSQVYLVDSLDPLSILAASAIALAVVMLAGWVPTRGARRMDIVEALRADP